MRISDWSSDVCSSDLPFVRRDASGLPKAIDGYHLDYGPQRRLSQVSDKAGKVVARYLHDAFGHRIDRKSVVWGKSVSVRVDLGGRRIIKKKKKRQMI